MVYNIVFAILSIVMGFVFGLPGATCVAIVAGTIKFSIGWWTVALTETFIMSCIILYWNIRRGA